MKRSGIRDAMPMIKLGIPGFRKASSGLHYIDASVYGRTSYVSEYHMCLECYSASCLKSRIGLWTNGTYIPKAF